MNDREKALLRMAVIYALANIDDMIEAFETAWSETAWSRETDPPVRELSVGG